MEVNRRGFLGAILTAGVAPAIVKADSLMRIVQRQVSALPRWSLVEQLGEVYVDASKAHLIQVWERPGLPSRWIERIVELPGAQRIGVDVAWVLAHRQFSRDALLVLAASPDWPTINARDFEKLHQQLVDQRRG